MLPNINPTTTESWKKLEQSSKANRLPISDLLNEPDRLDTFSLEVGELYFDFSKNSTDSEVLDQLLTLAEECGLKDAISAQFSGEKINRTEDRAVLHTELRKQKGSGLFSSEVYAELDRIKSFSQKLLDGDWKGHTGKQITDVVNLGIGGSDLGPKMAAHALRPYWKSITPHFISNVDAQQLVEVLGSLDPETTLFIVASKSFTTQETMTNAESARHWFLGNGGNDQAIAKHFVAVSTNAEAVAAFGIDTSNMFVFWDWVGGRYSLWSSIGLSIACAVGYENFELLLRGAEKMDHHFSQADFAANAPVIAALIGIWYNNFLNYESVAILPYDHRLRFLPSYLQQADMESNGKQVDRNGQPVNYQTGPIIWGEPGTNGQHAFYQLIHQGTKIVPCDFIAAAKSAHTHDDHHNKLLANFFAQTEALAQGKDAETVSKELAGKSEEEIARIGPFKEFEGNRPSTSILLKELNPFNLGMLIAFYEHKIFVQGAIWNIYSYDQWGVELGKQLAKPILGEIEQKSIGNHDASTQQLFKKFQEFRK